MEEIYTLTDGSQVDLSGKSQFEKTSFLVKNPGAKKQKGVAKSAVATPKKTITPEKNTDLVSKDGSSEPRKWRLPNQADLDTMQNKGILPPSSANPVKYIDDYKGLYDLKQNEAKVKATWKDQKIQTAPGKKAFDTKIKFNGSDEEIEQFVKDFRDNPITGELGENNKYKILKAKEDIHNFDLDSSNPYMFYSSVNQETPDDFVENNFKAKELQDLGINPQDFDGFLNKKGYKSDYLDKEAKGLFEGEGRDAWGGYDIGLAKELAKKKLLNMYMEDAKRRDFSKQDLNQDIQIAIGDIEEKNIVDNELFDTRGLTKYVSKNFPILTQKLKDRDTENAKIYKESKAGGTDFFSWDTIGKIGKSGWNAVSDRTAQISASAYSAIGMEGTAEGVRMLDEENKLVKPDDRGYSYTSGKSVEYNGTNYLVDSKGEIYDTDSKIRVTDLFNDDEHSKIVKESEYGSSNWSFSGQGAAVQTSGVMADMIIQAAVTRGIGTLGGIATGTRVALVGAGKTSRFTSLLNDTSKLLKAVPLKREVGYSMISQGVLGYTQGYEDTLKAARDAGKTDAEAFELAAVAGQRMAVLYSTTGVINPQTGVAENLFGSKNIVKKAIEQYTKTGINGFKGYIDNVIKNTPRNLIEFAEEGGKEVLQENIQQMGEIGINKMTNRDAGQKIMNEVMTGDDFMNTSILSFISSGLISKAKMPNFRTPNQNIDDLTSLSTLAKNKIEFVKVIDGLVGKKVFTVDQADKLKEDVEVYNNNINRLPTSVSPEVAMPVLRKLDKINKLESEKKRVSKAFHEGIDSKIDKVYGEITQITYEDELRVKNEAIAGAIKKGVIKDTQMKTFSNSEDMNKYLHEELNIPLEEVGNYSREGGFALNAETLKKYSKDPNSISKNAQIIFVNESRSNDAGVIQHEFLHGLLQNTLKDNPEAQKLVGVALSQELLKLNDALIKKGSKERALPGSLMQRLNLYAERAKKQQTQSAMRLELEIMDADGDESKIAKAKLEHEDYVNKSVGVKWEEMLTLYSDALRSGNVTYDEGTFVKLGDIIRRVLQYLGIKDIKFESGKDVYNFIKDYNSSVETGRWGKAITKMGDKGAKVDLEKLSKETGLNRVAAPKEKVKQEFRMDAKFSLSDKKPSEQIKKDINSKYDKEKWSTGSTRGKDSNPAVERVLYDILEEYAYMIKGKSKALGYTNLPDYSDIDMISETQMALIPHIRNFNREFFEKREEYKKELIEKGLDSNSKEFKEAVEVQDEKGYKGKKGIVKENDDLNGWINSQIGNKMKIALNSGNVTTQKFTEDIEGEMFKESKISDGFGGDETYLEDEGDNIFETEQEYQVEQDKLAILLKDPIYRFTDENGKDVNIETVPMGANYVTQASDPTVSANKKLKTETDPAKIAELKQEIKDLTRGLELESKKDLTDEEKQELNSLKSFKSFDLSMGNMVNTYKALSIEDSPAKIVTREVADRILASPNIATLEYRNFKEKLSDMSKTMMKRITFEHGPGLESLMYKNWKLLYGVINHPIDPVTGESSYASKKLPPTLKEFDEKGNLRKIGDITRVKFLQAFYEVEDVTRIIKLYGGANAEKELKQLEPREINPQTGNRLSQNAHFDRRTALRELFGDVMVLQEARRLLRNPEFLERVAEKQVNLYNELKDDIIRGKVLESMAKGKSDIVKFSLATVERKVVKKPDYITKNPFNMVGDNPTYDLKYVELFSSPLDITKFSLSDIEEKASEPIPKFKDLLKSINLSKVDDKEGWVLKTLQQSDVQDDDVKVKKLHTLKSIDKVEEEVRRRFEEIMNDFYSGIENNPYIIQEYKEGYIETMLERALTVPEEAFHIPYWTKMRTDEDFKKQELRNTQNTQLIALRSISDAISGSEFLDSSNLIFFRYLFLKDALSNRYYVKDENSIVKKSVKKSDYRTTIQPIQDFDDVSIVRDIWRNYSDIKSTSLAALYLVKKFQEAPIDFEDNMIQDIDEKTSLYKFNRGTNDNEVKKLNKLASYSVKSGYEGSSWCTGVSKSMAKSQLEDGDFYIIANKGSKIPVIAVRYVEDEISEVAGTRDRQELWKQDFNKVEFAINNLPSSNRETALNQLNIAKKLYDFTGQEIENMDSQSDLEKLCLSKNINIHFESEIYEKSKKASITLRKLLLENQYKSGVSPLEIYKKGFNINEDGDSNVTSDFDLDVLKQITEFVDDVSIRLQYPDGDGEDYIDFMEEVGFPYEDLQLSELKKAKVLTIQSIGSLKAPKLTDAKILRVEYEKNYGQSLLSLPSKINYDVDITMWIDDIDETPEILVFDKETDMSGKSLGIYLNDQPVDGINLSNVNNVDTISVTGIQTDYIHLPKKIVELNTENLEPLNTSKIEITGLKEVEKLNIEMYGFENLWFSSLNKIGTLEFTLRDEYDSDAEKAIIDSDIFKVSDNVIFNYEDHSTSQNVSKTLKSKPLPEVTKFSLAEEENGRESTFLSGLPFSQQWIVARDIDKAVNNAKMATSANAEESNRIINKIKQETDPVKIKDLKEELLKMDRGQITFRVPDISAMTDKEAAYLIIQKAAFGYNNFEFMPGQQANTPLLKQVMDSLDFKSKEYQETLDRNSNIEKTINDFIETNKGVASSETFSPETAKNLGKNIGLHTVYIPPEDEDFEGLLYALASAGGKEGEKQLAFMRDNLLKPYSDAMLNLVKARQVLYKDWQELVNKKYKGISKLLKEDSGYGGYLVDQAVRVYLWRKAEYTIPGLDTKDVFHLLQIVRNNPKLRAFAEDVSLISKQANGYSEPGHNWGYGSVVGDINNIISKSNRAKFLEHWTQNIDRAFSKENLSKIEAVYGRKYSKALKNSIERMKSGTNRTEGQSDGLLNWLNGANSVVMFGNMRSALLQTLGAVNYINTSDNNILKAGAALLNVPQYVKDFHTIWNSDYLKDRRSNLTSDVAEAEIAQIVNDPRNINMLDKMKALNYYILKNGYGPTRVMDSVAIALGGAGFYRNRLNSYLKQGKTQEEAEKLTLRDLYETSEINQQSADVSKISMNQASTKGRLILAFLNTPFQYSRLIKKSAIDLVKGRGSVANNIAKIVYYGAVQNLLFNFLQNALFARFFDDDEEKKKGKYDTATIRTAMGTVDTLLKGSGLRGVLLSTVAKAIVKVYEKRGDPNGFGDVALELSSFVPAVGIKLRALSKAYEGVAYNMKEIKREGFSIHNTYAIQAVTSVTSAAFNFPVDRLYQKIQNMGNALDSDNETWKRIFYFMGYSEYNLDPKSGKVKLKSNGEFSNESFKSESFKTEKF